MMRVSGIVGGRPPTAADDQRWHRRMARYLVGDTAEDESADSPAAVASHHDQIGRGGGRDDLPGRVAERDDGLDIPPLAAQWFGNALQIGLAVRFGRANRGEIGQIRLNGQEADPSAGNQLRHRQRCLGSLRAVQRDQNEVEHEKPPGHVPDPRARIYAKTSEARRAASPATGTSLFRSPVGTRTTGTGPSRISFSATLPSSQRLTPPRP